MKLFTILSCVVVGATAVTARSQPNNGTWHDTPQPSNNTGKAPVCTYETAVKRKEYGSMSDHEKLSYIHAVQCLMQAPSRYPAGAVPAATSQWLDFTAAHVNNTLNIHFSGLLLPWHRHFLYLLEAAMWSDCGYPSHLGVPYWDYPLYPDMAASPVFDGSATSLGSNGSAADGCIETGPFAGANVSFGPFPPVAWGMVKPENWTAANPRCMQRRLSDDSLALYNNQSDVDAVLASPDITTVLRWMNSAQLLDGFTAKGVHGGGHSSIGGTNGDFFGSAQDPAFYVHHAMVDRLWALWQEGHPGMRYAYNGTSTIFNPPGVTPEVVNSTVMSFGIVGDPITVGETADPMSGAPYCYVYL